MVMQDSGRDDGIDPAKIDRWRDVLLKHNRRATLGTVAVPDPEAKDGWVEMPMLTVVLEAERAELERYKQWVANLQEDVRAMIDCLKAAGRG